MRKADYDDEALVEDLACGSYSQTQVAERHKLTTGMISLIASGQRRPELTRRIEQRMESYGQQAIALAKRAAAGAIAQLVAIAKDDDVGADTRRKAACDLMNYAVGDPSKSITNITQMQQAQVGVALGVTADEQNRYYEIIAAERGGPGDERENDGDDEDAERTAAADSDHG